MSGIVEPRELYLILAGLSFIPPLLFMFWVRSDEKTEREPIGAMLGLFLYAGTLGIALALFLNYLGAGRSLFWAAVFLAPFVEELAKGLGFNFVRRHINELEDGIVYGAALGLGFAATENFLYGAITYNDVGAGSAVGVIIARVFSSMLLHACSSALLGFGVALAFMRKGFDWQILPFYLIAVGLHALYNFLVLSQSWAGFVAAIVMVIVVTVVLRQRIRNLDKHVHQGRPSR